MIDVLVPLACAPLALPALFPVCDTPIILFFQTHQSILKLYTARILRRYRLMTGGKELLRSTDEMHCFVNSVFVGRSSSKAAPIIAYSSSLFNRSQTYGNNEVKRFKCSNLFSSNMRILGPPIARSHSSLSLRSCLASSAGSAGQPGDVCISMCPPLAPWLHVNVRLV
jgi:hypothetical protein